MESRIDSCRESLAEPENRRRLFQKDALLPLLFIIAIQPNTLKMHSRIQSSKSQENIYHLMYIDDITLL